MLLGFLLLSLVKRVKRLKASKMGKQWDASNGNLWAAKRAFDGFTNKLIMDFSQFTNALCIRKKMSIMINNFFCCSVFPEIWADFCKLPKSSLAVRLFVRNFSNFKLNLKVLQKIELLKRVTKTKFHTLHCNPTSLHLKNNFSCGRCTWGGTLGGKHKNT